MKVKITNLKKNLFLGNMKLIPYEKHENFSLYYLSPSDLKILLQFGEVSNDMVSIEPTYSEYFPNLSTFVADTNPYVYKYMTDDLLQDIWIEHNLPTDKLLGQQVSLYFFNDLTNCMAKHFPLEKVNVMSIHKRLKVYRLEDIPFKYVLKYIADMDIDRENVFDEITDIKLVHQYIKDTAPNEFIITQRLWNEVVFTLKP